jgi:hypothetical protein
MATNSNNFYNFFVALVSWAVLKSIKNLTSSFKTHGRRKYRIANVHQYNWANLSCPKIARQHHSNRAQAIINLIMETKKNWPKSSTHGTHLAIRRNSDRSQLHRGGRGKQSAKAARWGGGRGRTRAAGLNSGGGAGEAPDDPALAAAGRRSALRQGARCQCRRGMRVCVTARSEFAALVCRGTRPRSLGRTLAAALRTLRPYWLVRSRALCNAFCAHSLCSAHGRTRGERASAARHTTHPLLLAPCEMWIIHPFNCVRALSLVCLFRCSFAHAKVGWGCGDAYRSIFLLQPSCGWMVEKSICTFGSGWLEQ